MSKAFLNSENSKQPNLARSKKRVRINKSFIAPINIININVVLLKSGVYDGDRYDR